MAADSVTRVTNESWFSRLGNAVKGVLIGFVLVVVALVLLFWNEGRSVERYKTLKEGGGLVVSVAPDAVDPGREGQLVHVTGRADTEQTLADSVFGVSAPALHLKRTVVMYQWQESTQSESRKKLGGGKETVTTYSYNKTWSGQAIDSSRFEEPAGHENPGALPYASDSWTAAPVTLGAYTLSPSLVGRINDFEPLAVPADHPLPEGLQDNVRREGQGFYIGAEPGSPRIGDVRISFSVARPTDVSVIARQVGASFEPFAAKAGGKIELLMTGIHSSEAMIEKAQNDNKMMTWLIRLGGFVLMLVAFNMIFSPLSVLADVVPMIGNIVGVGTGLIAFLLAAMLSTLTIAVAWVVYRPLLGIALLVVAAALIVVIVIKLKGARAAS